jgi:hypothetical protein
MPVGEPMALARPATLLGLRRSKVMPLQWPKNAAINARLPASCVHPATPQT